MNTPAPRPVTLRDCPRHPSAQSVLGRLALGIGAVAFGIAGQPAPAQPSAADAGPGSDHPIVLSPFELDSTKENGFVAANSLAGTRLMTALKDTPAPYSVITSEFIQALGITDLNKATNWTVGAFYSPDNNTNQAFGIIQFSVIRGTAPGQSQYPTRNYFPDNVIFDSYNVDQYEYGRGSNSILFGSSAFGGNANVATNQALLNRTIDTLSASYGSWNQVRATADVNQPIGDRAAVRVDLVWQNNDGDDWRLGNAYRKKGAFITGSWQPWKNTEIRLDGEYGEMAQIDALTTLTDQLSGWDGKSTFAAANPALALTTAQKNSEGLAQQGISYVYNPAGGSSSIINYQNVPTTIAGGGVGTYIGGQPVVGNVAIQTGAPMLFAQNLPLGRYVTDLSGAPGFYIPGRAFSMAWKNQPTSSQNFRNTTLTLDHHIGESLFFQVAGELSKESFFGQNALSKGSQTALIDVNQTLPTGAPNPEYLQPYAQASQYNEPRWVDFRNLRAAAAYIKDTPLGNFAFNVLGGMQWQRNENRAYLYALPLTSDIRSIPLAASSYNVNYRWYWNSPNRSLANFTGPVTVVNPITGTTQSVTPIDVIDSTRTDNNSSTLTDYKYLQAAVTDKLWGDKLVLLAAARRDFYNLTNRGSMAPEDYPATWNGQNVIFRPDAPANYYNLTYYPKDVNGNITGPLQPAITRPRSSAGVGLAQYAGDKFESDYNPPKLGGAINTLSFGAVYNLTSWAGLYGDVGQTFTLPQANAISFSLSLLPPTTSRSYDAGIRFHLLGGRIEISLGGYQSRNRAAEIKGVGITDFNGIYALAPAGDGNPGDQNALGIPQLPTVIEDTVDQSNRGVEFELTANLTSNWRIMANASDARTYQDSPDQGFLAYYAGVAKSLQTILAQGGVVVNPTTNIASTPNLTSANNANGQVVTAANAWNDLEGNVLPTIVNGRVEFVGSMELRANVFTDYTFDRWMVKGLRVGGGLQYFGKEVLGTDASEQAVNPANPATSILVGNPYQIIYSKPYVLGTGTIGYTWKLNRRRSVDFRLVIDNLFNYSEPIYYVNVPGSNTNDLALRPPGGNVGSAARVPTPNNYYYQEPRNYTLTATLNF